MASRPQTRPRTADRRAARLLRRRRPRDPHRRTGDREARRAGLCPARDRPQQVRRRYAEGARARCSSRNSTRCPTACRWCSRAHGVPKAVPAKAAERGLDLSRRDLPAGQQGPSPGRTAGRGGPAYRVHRPCRPSRGDRHVRPGARRVDDAGRDRRRCRGVRAGRSRQSRVPDADDAVGRRHRGSRRGAAAPLSRRSRRRAARTSATRRRTARPRSRRSRSACDAMLVIGAPNSSNSLRLVEVAEREGTPARLIQRAADLDWAFLDGVGTLGITAGASAPELLVRELVDRLADALRGHRARGRDDARDDRVQAAARARSGRLSLGGLHACFGRSAGRLPDALRCRRPGLGQGHRRGGREFATTWSTRPRAASS